MSQRSKMIGRMLRGEKIYQEQSILKTPLAISDPAPNQNHNVYNNDVTITVRNSDGSETVLGSIGTLRLTDDGTCYMYNWKRFMVLNDWNISLDFHDRETVEVNFLVTDFSQCHAETWTTLEYSPGRFMSAGETRMVTQPNFNHAYYGDEQVARFDTRSNINLYLHITGSLLYTH
jgi:hypothetical protein